jgi:hypothetical protein
VLTAHGDQMRCKVVLAFKDWANHQLYFVVVYKGSEENLKFFKQTPGGQLVLNVTNEDMFRRMEQGREYYLDFTLAGPLEYNSTNSTNSTNPIPGSVRDKLPK